MPKAKTAAALPEERFLATVAYEGTDFAGWQVQPNGPTVQAFLEARLAQIFKRPVAVHGSGRTDAGVHSLGQCCHFDVHWPHPAATLLRALRSGEPGGVLVRKVVRVPPNFHARFDAAGKRYRYEIRRGHPLPWEARTCLGIGDRKLDLPAMRKAAKLLLGRHDFTAFGANHGQGMENENPVKDLRRLDIRSRGERITIVTEASGYLYKMVRRLVGGLLRVGRGEMTPARLLAYRDERKVTAEVPTAPARGLFMDKVFYPAKPKLPLTTPRKTPRRPH
ncbi:MAG: tRNA pseudouridine(38-40) synthase TruA [Opitutia bacterium]